MKRLRREDFPTELSPMRTTLYWSCWVISGFGGFDINRFMNIGE